MPETKTETIPAILRRELYPCEVQCKANQTTLYELNNLTGHTSERINYICQSMLGEIVRVMHVWFSAGCQNYVHIFVFLNENRILPSSNPRGSNWVTGGLIGDDLPRPIPLDLKLRKGDEITVKYTNTDTSNDHTVVITLEIEKVRVKEKPEEPKAEEEKQKVEESKPKKKVLIPQVKMDDLRRGVFGPILGLDASGIGGDASDAVQPVVEQDEDSSQA